MGGGGGGRTGRAVGEVGGGQQWDGGQGGGGAIVIGGQQWGVFNLSSALQTISKSPKQFELKQSWKALRALNARWALPVYPVFEDEKSKASDEKSVKRKIA